MHYIWIIYALYMHYVCILYGKKPPAVPNPAPERPQTKMRCVNLKIWEVRHVCSHTEGPEVRSPRIHFAKKNCSGPDNKYDYVHRYIYIYIYIERERDRYIDIERERRY